MRGIKASIVYILAVLMLLGQSGCGTPEKTLGLTREEAALYTAIAQVCPKDDNNTKMDCLTFDIEGWSFDTIPEPILEYLQEYCANGGAKLIQLSYDELRAEELITAGDGDYYDTHEDVYLNGKGKLFTFAKAGDENSDEITVKLTAFVSTEDTSGYDILLKYNKNAWEFVKYDNAWSNAWSQTQSDSPAPDTK